MTMPLVSCILPVFNGERFLARALDSIFAQDGARLEVIVVDDGSTDRSAEIAAGFAGVRLIRQPNGGVARARNEGVAHAEGGFIAFLDADDLWLAGKLAKQLACFEAEPGLDLCLTLVRHVRLDDAAPDVTIGADTAPKLGRLMQCLLARRDAFARVGPLDPGTRTRADRDWFLRAQELGLVEAVVPEVLVHRQIHGGNRSIVEGDAVTDDLLTIAKRALDRRRRAGLPLALAERWTPAAANRTKR